MYKTFILSPGSFFFHLNAISDLFLDRACGFAFFYVFFSPDSLAAELKNVTKM